MGVHVGDAKQRSEDINYVISILESKVDQEGILPHSMRKFINYMPDGWGWPRLDKSFRFLINAGIVRRGPNGNSRYKFDRQKVRGEITPHDYIRYREHINRSASKPWPKALTARVRNLQDNGLAIS